LPKREITIICPANFTVERQDRQAAVEALIYTRSDVTIIGRCWS